MRLSPKTSFIIAAILLATCALSLEGATRLLKLHFRKERVELAQPIETIPPSLGPWVQVTIDRPLPEDHEHILGTSQYVMRKYVDSRIISPEALAGLREKSETERNTFIATVEREHPEAVVNFWFTYYTGLADTVAHVPDRCYIADGYSVTSADEIRWPKADKNVRFLTFEDATGVGRVTRNVAYLFSANGQYVADPIDVRRVLGNLFSKYGYYAKLELMTHSLERDQAARVMDDFLSSAMPAVQQVLPDWNQYKGK